MINPQKEEEDDDDGSGFWNQNKPFLAIAIANFVSKREEDEDRCMIDLSIGDIVRITHSSQGWFFGQNLTSKSAGIFPTSFVAIWPSKPDSVLSEVSLTLHEWKPLWQRLYQLNQNTEFFKVYHLMERLLHLRRQLQMGVLTQDQVISLELRMTESIDAGNALLGLELVPREDNGTVVDEQTAGPVHLFNRFAMASEKRKGVDSDNNNSVRTINTNLSLSNEGDQVKTPSNFFLVVKLSNFLYPKLEEDILLYVSLRKRNSDHHKSTEFLSEKAFVDEKSDQVQVIFPDLHEFHNIFLVFDVYKSWKSRISDGPEPSEVSKRPFACAVIGPLKNIKIGDSKFWQTKFFTCGEEKDFHGLHEQILKNSSNLKTVWSNARLDVTVQSMKSMESTGYLSQEHQILFKSSIISRRTSLSPLMAPNSARNDLYLILDHGNFERSGKARNIEVSVCVLDKKGSIIPDCIYSSAGLEAQSKVSFPVLYHTNSPCWQEIVRFQVEIQNFEACHVRLEFRHCSHKDKNDKKFLGFSFFNLMESDGTTIKDGTHSLCIYKCEDQDQLVDSSVYLPLAYRLSDMKNPEQVSIHRGFVRSSKDNVTIKTKLCSTKLTQNVHLMSLLNWKSDSSKIPETLRRVLLVDGEEIVKFIQDILDALFEMFTTEDGNSTGHSGLVFTTLVYIITSIQTPKFKQFGSIMDTYINEHFSAALVYKGLLTCLRHFTDHVLSKEENQDPIQKCFQSIESIMKLVIRSRILFVRTSISQVDNTFRDSVKLLFDSFNKMLSHSGSAIRTTQIVFLRHISSVFPHLLQIMPVIEVAEFATLMFATLCRDLPDSVSEALLGSLQQVVNSPIFQDSEARSLFLTTCCTLIRKYLMTNQHLSMTSHLLGDILMFFHMRINSIGYQGCLDFLSDIHTLQDLLLGPLIETLLKLEDEDFNSEARGRLLSCLLALLNTMEENHFRTFWEKLNYKQTLKPFMLQCFLLLQTILGQKSQKALLFPKDWQLMHLSMCKTFLKTLQEFSKPLLIYFREKEHFDRHLWMNYFTATVSFVSYEAVETRNLPTDIPFSYRKFQLVETFQNLRMRMGYQLLSLWSHLGDLKQHFIPGIVGPLLKMTLVPMSEMRKSAIPVYYDLLSFEFKLKGHLRQIESELVDKLDILVQENKADADYKDIFANMLRNIIKDRNPSWRESGLTFIESVTTFLERLLEYRKAVQLQKIAPVSLIKWLSEASSDKQMSCIVSLLNYYKSEPNRQELFHRYIYKLHDLHLPVENFVEAAYTLKLHADTLKWSNKTLHSDLRYPNQKEWERKEQLYLKIIDLLEKGKHWEHAVPMCKELAKIYEEKVMDYRKLSDILQRQANLFSKIISSSENALRIRPEYFRVGFFGNNYPIFLKNKEFIYRGLEFENLSAFTQRISEEFPNAQILSYNSPISPDQKEKDEQWVQICCVKPVSEISNASDLEGFSLPEIIRRSKERISVSKFQYDKPFHKGPRDNNNEFKTLWLERTFFTTESSFPGILRWFEVVKAETEEISPISHACESISAKNAEIQKMIMDPSAQPIQKLSLSLQGVIDAAVNGGIAKYQEAFFGSSFVEENPEFSEDVARLQHIMAEQVDILEEALKQHERLISNEVRPLHEHLLQRWKGIRDSVNSFRANNSSHPIPVLRRTSKSSRKGPLPPIPSKHSSTQMSRSANSSLNMSLQSSQFYSDEDGSIYSQPTSLDSNSHILMTTSTSFSMSRSIEDVSSQNGKGPPLPPRLGGSQMSSLASDSPPPIPPKSLSPAGNHHQQPSPPVRKYELIE